MPRRGRRDVGRVRRRHAGARPRGHRRAGVRHRHRRASRSAAAAAGSSASSASPATTCIEAEVVTADGRRSCASDDENPDLFWGLRGGGGNFGVVTAFHFRLHPIGPIVLGGMLMYPAADGAASCVRFYRDFMRDAPDEVGGGLAFITAPPEDFVPEPVRGQPVIGVVVLLRRRRSRTARRCCAPLREFGPPAHRPGRADAVRRGAAAARPGRTRRACRTTGRPTSSPSCPTRRSTCSSSTATKPVSPLTQIILVAGRRRDRPGRRGRDRVRAAHARRGTSTTCRCGPTRPTTETQHRVHPRRSRRR